MTDKPVLHWQDNTMNSKQRRAMLHNIAKALTGPYIPETPRMEAQLRNITRTRLHYRLGIASEWIADAAGHITKVIPYKVTRTSPSGQEHMHTVRNKTAIRWDREVKAQ
jgi:hypothetical protein